MSISPRDIKRLWALSAGRCNYPSCSTLCVDRVSEDPEPFIVGHMAHVIAKQPGGPRGTSTGGNDGYSNRILLCPNHHRVVDAAPSSFPPNTLVRWKKEHETRVEVALSSPSFTDRRTMAEYIHRLLIENKTIWQTLGPDSLRAAANPMSNAVNLWALRKLDTIVPNNRRIVNTVHRHKNLFDADSYAKACQFVVHAEGFERNCYQRTEDVPRFPKDFEAMITAYVQT